MASIAPIKLGMGNLTQSRGTTQPGLLSGQYFSRVRSGLPSLSFALLHQVLPVTFNMAATQDLNEHPYKCPRDCAKFATCLHWNRTLDVLYCNVCKPPTWVVGTMVMLSRRDWLNRDDWGEVITNTRRLLGPVEFPSQRRRTKQKRKKTQEKGCCVRACSSSSKHQTDNNHAPEGAIIASSTKSTTTTTPAGAKAGPADATVLAVTGAKAKPRKKRGRKSSSGGVRKGSLEDIGARASLAVAGAFAKESEKLMKLLHVSFENEIVGLIHTIDEAMENVEERFEVIWAKMEVVSQDMSDSLGAVGNADDTTDTETSD